MESAVYIKLHVSPLSLRLRDPCGSQVLSCKTDVSRSCKDPSVLVQVVPTPLPQFNVSVQLTLVWLEQSLLAIYVATSFHTCQQFRNPQPHATKNIIFWMVIASRSCQSAEIFDWQYTGGAHRLVIQVTVTLQFLSWVYPTVITNIYHLSTNLSIVSMLAPQDETLFVQP